MSDKRTTETREHDIVLFGATGFTGRLTAEYLAAKSLREPLKWAIAGRNKAKLEEVRRALEAINPAAAKVKILEASVDDPASLARVAKSTRVVLTTVGPYAKYGEPMVKACVDEGADYVDITGEPDFVDMTMTKYGEAAEAKGIRIVSCCGFDSVPHDLGVFYTMKQLPKGHPAKVEGFVRANGTFSGGTWQSAIHAMANIRKPRGPKEAKKGHANGRKVRGLKPGIRFVRELKAWGCPMPTIDPQIVLRSARALDEYGPSFQYGHYAQIKSTFTLAAGIAGIGAVVALAQLPPTRKLLEKVKSSGDGPNEERRKKGWFRVTFLSECDGKKFRTRVSGGDPGYAETAKMVAESALCLAHDRAKLPKRAGVLTPAVAMGDALLERLSKEGIVFETL